MNSASVTIYALFDPQDPDRTRYIGKTDFPLRVRLGQHIREARSGVQSYRHKWLRSLLTAGVMPGIRTLETARKAEWPARERHWIAHFRSTGHPLTNGSAGGDGLDSASWKEIWSRPGMRQRSSVAMSRYLSTEVGRKQRSASSKKAWSDLEARRRRIAGIREMSMRPEVRRARSASTTATWADPEIRRKRIDGINRKLLLKRRAKFNNPFQGSLL